MRLCSCRSPHRSGPGIMPRASHGSAEAKTAISRLTDYTRGFVSTSIDIPRITNITPKLAAGMKGASGVSRSAEAAAAGGMAASAPNTIVSTEMAPNQGRGMGTRCRTSPQSHRDRLHDHREPNLAPLTLRRRTASSGKMLARRRRKVFVKAGATTRDRNPQAGEGPLRWRSSA